MDPCRIRAYLQVACAGLGFEIGEIWWTGNEHGSSTVAAIAEKNPNNNNLAGGSSSSETTVNKSGARKLRFVQLYTSKSFENRRSELINPPEDRDGEGGTSTNIFDSKNCEQRNTAVHDHVHHQQQNHHQQQQQQNQDQQQHECTTEDLEKHKLSPRLVDAISKTAQVVWANTLKQEGLTGRSDIPLHTAVGMPVAVDADGNMCVVVMFSPSHIPNTNAAMEYLQSISRSATSSSIPCLMPAFENTENIQHVPTVRSNAIKGHIMADSQHETSFGEGVTARFVPMVDDGTNDEHESTKTSQNNNINNNMQGDLSTAPKDVFGIPMLPCFNEPMESAFHHGRDSPSFEEVFDEASYGVWSTIMGGDQQQQQQQQYAHPQAMLPANSTTHNLNYKHTSTDDATMLDSGIPRGLNEGPLPHGENDTTDDAQSLVTSHKVTLDQKRKDQLEEFCAAFLGMSVFDIADVWVPAGPKHPGCLSHITSICTSSQSSSIDDFKRVSQCTLIKNWSGAVGRAFASGNPVWSCNPDVYIDTGRSRVFEHANIMTAFAVPISIGTRATPVGVVCCYSLIQSGAVPFVLKFVQQALHLLWSGLDKVQPHESVGQEMWQDVRPADLGEMAADVEMQQHFISKKRPRSSSVDFDPQTAPLSARLNKIDIQQQQRQPAPVSNDSNLEVIPEYFNYQTTQQQEQQNQTQQPQQQLHPNQQTSIQAIRAYQNHFRDAVRQLGEAMPFTHSHGIATTVDGSKRAHVFKPRTESAPLRQPAPLVMPRALPTHVMKANIPGSNGNSNNGRGHGVEYGERIDTLHFIPVESQVSTNAAAATAAATSGAATGGAVGEVSAHASQTAPTQQMQPISFTQQLSASAMPPPQGSVPSKLSQNLLGQGMLQNISKQPCQVSRSEKATPRIPHNGTLSVPGSTAGIAVPQSQSQQLGSFCYPTNGSSYHATPDLSYSASTGIPTFAKDKSKVKICRIEGCDEPTSARRPYCTKHSGNRLCEHEGCGKCAQGSTRFCIAHGGGRRCTVPGCDKGARDKLFCAAHGGGKRCRAEGCSKSAVGGSSLCTAHGGGRRCSIEGCDKSAQSSTNFCVKHGGGKKCAHEGCGKVARGRTQYCAAHGGGVRCKLDGCNRVAIGKMQLCRAHGGGSRAPRANPNANISPTMHHDVQHNVQQQEQPQQQQQQQPPPLQQQQQQQQQQMCIPCVPTVPGQPQVSSTVHNGNMYQQGMPTMEHFSTAATG